MIILKKNTGKLFYGLRVEMLFLNNKKYHKAIKENTDKFVCIKLENTMGKVKWTDQKNISKI